MPHLVQRLRELLLMVPHERVVHDDEQRLLRAQRLEDGPRARVRDDEVRAADLVVDRRRERERADAEPARLRERPRRAVRSLPRLHHDAFEPFARQDLPDARGVERGDERVEGCRPHGDEDCLRLRRPRRRPRLGVVVVVAFA
eukprot:5775-Pelagococcus_subviridis.AAC.3